MTTLSATSLCTCPNAYHLPTVLVDDKPVCSVCGLKQPSAIITLHGVDSTAKERNDERREKGYRR
jgi:hypothetical protein